MTVGPVVGPFDNLIIVNATAYTISGAGSAFTNPPTGAGGDNNKEISFTSASAVTVTIPPGLERGFKCAFYQAGAGTVTYRGTGGVVINGITNGVGASTAQYTKDLLQCIDTNVFVLTHDTTTTTHS